MKAFFAGRKVKLLTDEEQTKGIDIWHMELEEKEMSHMTGRLEEAAVFLYVAEGRLVCQVNQEKEKLEKGEGLFVNRGNVYRLAECGRYGVELYVIIMEKEYVEADGLIAEKYIAPVLENELFFHLKLGTEQELPEILKNLGEAARNKEEGYELKLRSLAFELWLNLYREMIAYQPSVKKADVREKVKLCQMLEYIHVHYKEKITLGELAGNAGISTGEYCRFFKKKMNRTPFEYLQVYRISQSLPEILEKADTISNIALRHGFAGSSYFTETFKKEMGCAPGDYRKWYKGEMKECPLKETDETAKTLKKTEEFVSIRKTSMPAHLL